MTKIVPQPQCKSATLSSQIFLGVCVVPEGCMLVQCIQMLLF